jgi:hydroxymethylpyrimidine/phosphomethylpyrimidine kinase
MEMSLQQIAQVLDNFQRQINNLNQRLLNLQDVVAKNIMEIEKLKKDVQNKSKNK